MRTINELSTEELRIVFEVNAKLREEVAEDMAESEMFWIGEHISYIDHTLAEWSIGQCNRYQNITIRDHAGFIYAYEELHRDMQPLAEQYTPMVENAVRLADELYDVNMIDEVERAEELEEKVEQIAEEIADKMVATYTRTLDNYCLDDIHICDYFIDFYADARMDGDYYVDSDYRLFRDVSYTESYA